jgi:polysaccharide export outer membrane protein
MISRLFVYFALGCVLAPAGFSQDPKVAPDKKEPQDQKAFLPSADVRVGPGDTIIIQALAADEISKTWRVSSSGDLNLPMIGRIHVAGMTQDQLEEALTARLRKYVKEPQVNAYVGEVRSQPVVVAGAVQSPGTVQVDGAQPLFNVLAKAGGVKDPGPTVTVTREIEHGAIADPQAKLDPDGSSTSVDLKMQDAVDASTKAANFMVEPYDRITVATVKQPQMVYITGEVNHPGAVELVTQKKVSILSVLANAGGLTRTAKPSNAMLIHINPAGERTTVARLDLRKVIEGNIKDIELIAGDMVVVPSSELKTLMEVASTSALSAGIYVLARY